MIDTLPEFVHSYLLDERGGGHPCDASDVLTWQPGRTRTIWLHLDSNDEATRVWLAQRSGVPPSVVEAMLELESRPRVLSGDAGTLVVLRGVNMNPGDEPEDMVAIRVWVEPGRVISIRRRRLLAVQDVRETLDQGHGPSDPASVLTAVIERLADRIADVVNDIEDRIEQAEELLDQADNRQLMQKVGGLRRSTATLRRFLSPQRDALERLQREPPAFFRNADIERLRAYSDRSVRNLEDLDLARERAMVLQQDFLNLLAQQQNDRMYVLAIVAAIFLPLSFGTGLLGMNVGGLPGLESPVGFLFACMIMGAIGAGLMMYFRWKRWF